MNDKDVTGSGKDKGKGHSKTGHENPKEEKRDKYSFFYLGSGWGGVQRHAPAALPPEKRTGTHFIRDWVDPRAVLDGCGKERPNRDSIPGTSSP